MKTIREVTFVSEGVHTGPDVSYTVEPYKGAEVVVYRWLNHNTERSGESKLYGLTEEEARRLFDKWNKTGSGTQYTLLSFQQPDT